MRLGETYRQRADEVNKEKGEAIAAQALLQIKEDCKKAAERGEYKIICGQNVYGHLYNTTSNHYEHMMHKLVRILEEEQIELRVDTDLYSDTSDKIVIDFGVKEEKEEKEEKEDKQVKKGSVAYKQRGLQWLKHF